jgi:hypothetical protein
MFYKTQSKNYKGNFRSKTIVKAAKFFKLKTLAKKKKITANKIIKKKVGKSTKRMHKMLKKSKKYPR